MLIFNDKTTYLVAPFPSTFAHLFVLTTDLYTTLNYNVIFSNNRSDTWLVPETLILTDSVQGAIYIFLIVYGLTHALP